MCVLQWRLQKVDAKVGELRQDFTTTATTLATDLTRLAKEAGSLRADVSAVGSLVKRVDADVSSLDPRVSWRLQLAHNFGSAGESY